MEHYLWFGLFLITILWYFIVTVIVTFRGGRDIKEMIKKLRQ